MQNATVQVRLLDAPFSADSAYTYLLPEPLREQGGPGVFVTVPFGNGNRSRAGVIVSDGDAGPAEDNVKLKPVLSVIQERFPLSAEQLGLCSFLCDSTLCTFGDAVHAMLPAAAFSELVEEWEPSAPDGTASPKKTDAADEALLAYLADHGSTPVKELLSAFGDDSRKRLERLRAAGLAAKNIVLCESGRDHYERYLSLAVGEAEATDLTSDTSVRIRSEGQKAILRYLLTYGRSEWKTVQRQSGGTRPQVRALIERGYVTETLEEAYRNPYLSRVTETRGENILSEEQEQAYDTIRERYESGEAGAALLYGVTGSGKTRVIKKMVDRVLADGRRVIILVPEISLTPQTVDIFCGYYGSRVAVMHSSLSDGERFDAYKRIRRGEADVVIGTRSAVFAPVENLGLIVIDEEQEHTYKSDVNPKYHARDVARWRAAKNHALMLLASATPSLESFYRARQGRYTLVTMTKRYGGARLPDVCVVDMRREGASGNLSPISECLTEAAARAKADGKQAILFLNRRGYNHFAICRVCGEVVECPRCSVSLTYHTKRAGMKATGDLAQRARDGYLLCHYCGYRQDVPMLCPSCGSEHLAFWGYGTQRVEQELTELLPGITVLRMDMDTTREKFSYERMLGSFRNHGADVLLGTQMVAKGHDFPDVTLAGVLDADSALHLSDYRAGERTFSLITQVIGRAGRADSPGIAVIQTHQPEDETIVLACRQDYTSFYEKEIKLREKYLFPPFCDIVTLAMTSADELLLHSFAESLSETLASRLSGEYADVRALVFGPFTSPVYKLDMRYRMKIVIKCRAGVRCRSMLAALLRDAAKNGSGKITLSLDINPSSI